MDRETMEFHAVYLGGIAHFTEEESESSRHMVTAQDLETLNKADLLGLDRK